MEDAERKKQSDIDDLQERIDRLTSARNGWLWLPIAGWIVAWSLIEAAEDDLGFAESRLRDLTTQREKLKNDFDSFVKQVVKQAEFFQALR